MQTEQVTPETAAPSPKPDAEPRADLVGVTEHRIYVWSSPAPYAVVIQESRSFHRHI